MAQKDESLIGEMREQLRGDRERAAARTTTAPVAPEPVPEQPVEAAPSLGDRFLGFLGLERGRHR